MRKRFTGTGKGYIGGQYKPLTDQDVEQIHQASLTILERTGIQVEEPDTLIGYSIRRGRE